MTARPRYSAEFLAGMAADPDIRTRDCLACGGDPEWEVLTGYDPRDGSPTGWIERCGYCNGTGIAEVEVEPIDEDELERLYLATESADRVPASEEDRRAALEDNWFARNHNSDKAWGERNGGGRAHV